MRTTTGLWTLAVLCVLLIGGCAWMEENAPWLGVKASKEKAPVPVTDPSHQAVLRPQDGMILQESPAAPPTAPEAAGLTEPGRMPVHVAPAEASPREIVVVSSVEPAAPATQPVVGVGPNQADVDIRIDDFKPDPEPVPGPETPATQPAQEPTTPRREVVAASMVQVNDRFVAIEDVIRGLGSRIRKIPTTLSETAYRRQAGELVNEEVRRQVTQQLVLDEAQGRLGEPQKAHIDQEMADTLREMVATLGEGSRTKLQRELLRQGTTLEDVLAEQRKHLTVRLYLRTRFSPTVNVTRRMLWDYYKAHPEQFQSPRKVQVQLIALPYASLVAEQTGLASARLAAAKVHARAMMARAVRELQDGNDFGEVARRYSRGSRAKFGGLWDLMPAGSLREKRVEEVAFQLTEGQMAGPIETPDGLYVARAVKVVPAQRVEFVDAQDRIDAALREQQFQKLTEEYFRDLVGRATITQSPQFTKLAVDRIVREYYKPQ